MGMTTQYSQRDEAAHLWVIRLQDSAFDDWDGLTDWLEQDADHLAAYEAALQDDAWAAELFRHRPPAEPASQPIPLRPPVSQHRPQRRRWYAAGGAIAASLVAVATFTILQGPAPSEIVTAPGEHRTIPLADGSRIILNGATRITIDPDTPREVELASGEALFEVKHDERNPFVVTAGGTRLRDAGTVFNVVSDAGSLDVAVAEGSVIYEPGRSEIRLMAGDALSRASGAASPVLRKASPRAIGGWQSGQLEYGNAPLDQVARDLGRNLGLTIRPANGAERLRFTGTLVVDGKAADVLQRAGPLLGVDFAADGDAWRMTPANGAPPY
jgi:transmembrane sensor